MTSYLITIATDVHQSFVKMCVRDMRTATVNGRVYILICLGKIQEKPEKPYFLVNGISTFSVLRAGLEANF